MAEDLWNWEPNKHKEGRKGRAGRGAGNAGRGRPRGSATATTATATASAVPPTLIQEEEALPTLIEAEEGGEEGVGCSDLDKDEPVALNRWGVAIKGDPLVLRAGGASRSSACAIRKRSAGSPKASVLLLFAMLTP